MTKITDVAQKAGVSPSTVSHVLNGKRPISQATKLRVLAAIEELGYTPNLNARALKSSRTGIIGFFAADITEIFVTEIIRGVESVIVPAGDHLLLVSGSEFGNDLHRAIAFLRTRSVDGIIVSYGISQEYGDPEFDSGNLPLITINRVLNDRTPSIMPDNLKGGRDAAYHLKTHGAGRVAVIGGPRNRLASAMRIEGFTEMSRELNLELAATEHTEFSFEGGLEAMSQLLDTGVHFDGLFCANDYIAAGAMSAASTRGIRIPRELKVIGFDDRDFSRFWPIPITTFQQSLFSMGQQSAGFLKSFLDDGIPIPLSTFLPSTLQERQSTVDSPGTTPAEGSGSGSPGPPNHPAGRK